MKDKTIDYILRATWQAVARMYNEEASKFEGSMAIGFALLSIDREAGTPSTAISNRMGMEPTSLTRTLKTLEEKGLIIRKKNPEDGRGVLIYLTELGKEKRELSKNTVIKFNEVIKQNISSEKLNHFIEVTEIINDLIAEKRFFNEYYKLKIYTINEKNNKKSSGNRLWNNGFWNCLSFCQYWFRSVAFRYYP